MRNTIKKWIIFGLTSVFSMFLWGVVLIYAATTISKFSTWEKLTAERLNELVDWINNEGASKDYIENNNRGIQSWSNEIGEWVRFPDWTQFVRIRDWLKNSTWEWKVYYTDFPKAFTSVPMTFISLKDVQVWDTSGNHRNYDWWPVVRNTTKNWTEYINRRESSSGTATKPVIFAVGRWK